MCGWRELLDAEGWNEGEKEAVERQLFTGRAGPTPAARCMAS